MKNRHIAIIAACILMAKSLTVPANHLEDVFELSQKILDWLGGNND